jgi:hypothetical protein
MEEGEERERKKKLAMGEGGFPRAGPALLAMLWVTAGKGN